jgi:hypothetical protein
MMQGMRDALNGEDNDMVVSSTRNAEVNARARKLPVPLILTVESH